MFASQVVRGRRRDVFPRGRCPAALLSRCVGAGHAPGRARQRKRRGRVVGRTEEADADRLLGTWLSPAGSARPPLGQTGRGHAAGAARAACLPPRGDAQRVQKPERAGGAGLGGPRASPPGPESGALRCADGAAGRPDEWLPHRGHFLWDPGAGTAFFGETCSKFQCKSQSLKHSRGRQRGGRITHGTLVYLRDFSCQLVTRRTVHFRPWKRCADSQERKGVA